MVERFRQSKRGDNDCFAYLMSNKKVHVVGLEYRMLEDEIRVRQVPDYIPRMPKKKKKKRNVYSF